MKSAQESAEWESALYKGFVRHRRFSPENHTFTYPLFMCWIKLDEVPLLARKLRFFGNRFWHWARFKREDYVGDAPVSISDSVKQKIAEKIASDADSLDGEVYLLGHLRYLGLYFSPLNLYFLKQGDSMRYMLAEVSNTPWNQRHYYVLDLHTLAPHDKEFHVSPFNPMDQQYQWQIKAPDPAYKKSMVHLEVGPDANPEGKIFDATMVLKREPLNQTGLNRVLVSTPIQTASIVFGIYWQALKLFLKGVPFHSHPTAKEHSVPLEKH